MKIIVKNSTFKLRHLYRGLLFISLLFALFFASLFACMLSTNAANTVNVVDENGLRNAINTATEPTVIILNADIELRETPLNIASGKDITLKSSGVAFFRLIGALDVSTIIVNNGGVLELAGIIVAHANGASGNGVTVHSGGTLTLSDGKISDNTFDIAIFGYGGGVYNNGSFTMSGGVISGNTARMGGGGVYNGGSSSVFNLYDGKISNNTAGDGGGVYNDGGDFSVFAGGVISGNTAFHGGGIYNCGSSNFTLSGGEISDNTAGSSGGGVHNAGRFSLFAGGVISDNTVDGLGGGVYNLGDFNLSGGSVVSNNIASSNGGGVYNLGDFNLFDGVISNNTITAPMNGGGVYNSAGRFSVFAGGVISSNTANWGGGVCNVEGVFSLFGGVISNNMAVAYGGGVYSTGTFIMSDGVISDNTAATGGGVLINTACNFTMTSGSILNNIANSTHGGGVYNSASSFSLFGGVISNNTAISTGGGVFVSAAGDFTMSAGLIFNNVAASGGGVYTNGIFSLSGGGVISNNVANNTGSGVSVSATGRFAMSGGSISNNTALNTYGCGGGGVHNSGNFLFDAGEISNNTCQWGGGVYNSATGRFAMSGGSISNNKAMSNGGGVYNVQAGNFTMSYGKIVGNTAEDGGGVVNLGNFSLSGGAISNNAACDLGNPAINTNSGGGVYNAGVFELTGSATISNNSAAETGGGVSTSISDGTITIISGGAILDNTANNGGGVHGNGVIELSGNATISNNTAITSGGGMYVSGTFTMSGGVISGNTASGTGFSNGGGGVYNSKRFIMTHGEIFNNTAIDGGGVYNLFFSAFEFFDGAIFDNIATRNGGGIYNYDFMGTMYGFVMMSGGVVSNNSAVSGGGVYNAGEFTMTNGIIGGSTPSDANSAETGGGVFNTGSRALFNMFDAAVISGNSATHDGGGVNNANNGVFEMFSGAISTNAADNNGGGVYLSGGSFAISDACVISDNIARAGGGVYVGSGRSFSMFGGKIANNTAGIGGGVSVGSGASFDMVATARICDNTAISVDATATGVGGGVYLSGGYFMMSDYSVIANNTARAGGGVCITNSQSSFNMTDNARISNNTASSGTSGNGGGVHASAGSFNMETEASVDNNTASYSGGGVYVAGTGSFKMLDSSRVGNNRATNGGGLYVGSGASFNMADNARIDSNIATSSGGGVYNNGIFTMHKGSITNNAAVTSGGAVYSTNSFMMFDGKISGNSAVSGGGVYLSGTTAIFNVAGGEISSNRASGNGGGVWVTNTVTNLDLVFVDDGVVFSNNSASAAYMRAQEHDGLYAAQIGEHVSWTYPLEQGYNNFDISYVNGNPLKLTDIVVSFNVNPDNDPLIVSPTPASILVDLGYPYGTLPVVTQFGYIFERWSTEKGTPVTSSTNVTIGTDHTLFAQWTRIMVPVNVSHVYSASDIVGLESLSLPIGEYDLSQLYELIHSNDGGVSKTYNVSQVVVEKYVTITYNKGYRSSSSDQVWATSPGSVDYALVGSNYTIKTPTDAQIFTDVTVFNGWNTLLSGGGVDYGFGGSNITVTESLVLYAQWRINYLREVLPGFDFGGGIGFGDQGIGFTPTSITFPNGDDSVTVYDGDDLVNPIYTFEEGYFYKVTFYYELPEYCVTVVDSFDDVASGEGNYYEGDTVNISAGNRSGYDFSGWTVDVARVEFADHLDSTTLFTMPPCDVTVTANWTPWNNLTYVVHYYLEGTVDSVADSLTVIGQVMNSTVTVYPEVVAGYTAVESSLRGTLNVTGNVFVFYYTLDLYEIVYVLGEAGVNHPNNPSSYTVEDTLPIHISSPYRAGFAFLGWSVEHSDGSLDVGPIFSFNISKGMVGDLLLAAQWLSVPGDVPFAVDGRILPASMTGDCSVWFEIARYADCSLIVRKDYLNIDTGVGSYGNPSYQACSYSSSFVNDYSDGECLVRSRINDWFNGDASGSADNLPAGARLRGYTMRSNAVAAVGSSNVELSVFDGFSKPTAIQAGDGEDVAFALSFGETASFMSKSFFDRNTGYRHSFFVADTNYAKLVVPWGYGMWLRSPGDLSAIAGYLNSAGRVYQYPTDPSGSSEGGLVYPALWVHTSIFDL